MSDIEVRWREAGAVHRVTLHHVLTSGRDGYTYDEAEVACGLVMPDGAYCTTDPVSCPVCVEAGGVLNQAEAIAARTWEKEPA